MKVKELIEKLQGLDQEAVVNIPYVDNDGYVIDRIAKYAEQFARGWDEIKGEIYLRSVHRMKIMVKKAVFRSLDLSWLAYHLYEGFGVDFNGYRVRDNHVNLYFLCEFKRQREVVQALRFLGVDTSR